MSKDDQLHYDKQITEAAELVGKLSFTHSSLDEAGLPSGAFRVYSHLLRRCNGFKSAAYPSYQSIGDICFSGDSDSPVTRRKKAIEGVKVLVERRFIEKKTNFTSKGQSSNIYYIKSPDHWLAVPNKGLPAVPNTEPLTVPNMELRAVPNMELRAVPNMDHKGTSIEGTPIEGTSKPPIVPLEQPKSKAEQPTPTPTPWDYRTDKPYVRRSHPGQALIADAVASARKVGVEMKEFIALVNVYLDIHGLTALADLGTPAGIRTLNEAQTAMETLIVLGIRTEAELRDLIESYHRANAWTKGNKQSVEKYSEYYLRMKREKNGQPTLSDLSKYHESNHESYDYSGLIIEPPDEPMPGFPGARKLDDGTGGQGKEAA